MLACGARLLANHWGPCKVRCGSTTFLDIGTASKPQSAALLTAGWRTPGVPHVDVFALDPQNNTMASPMYMYNKPQKETGVAAL